MGKAKESNKVGFLPFIFLIFCLLGFMRDTYGPTVRHLFFVVLV